MKSYRKPTRLHGPQGLQRKRGAVEVGRDKFVSMLLPAAIASVRWGSCHWRKRWHALARFYGLGWRLVVQEEDAYLAGGASEPSLDRNITVAVEVWGVPEALAKAMSAEVVASVEYRCHEANVMFPTKG